MPAHQPAELHELFQFAFNARDLEGLVALYQTGAVFVTGPGASVTGHDAIRQVYRSMFAMKPVMRLETASVLQAGDLAMLESRWVLIGSGAEGDPVQITGSSREVACREANGTWLYAIDDPGVGK